MIWKIAWKNIVCKPLNSALCISLLLFGAGIMIFLLLIQNQLEQKFERDLNEIDLVVGANGSPLQLVLSAIYHLDAPTGNINLAEAKKIMEGPMVNEAIPLAYGDSYKGYRILGTITSYIEKYEGQVKEGSFFKASMEATIGSRVAEKTGLKVGDKFLGTHGEVKKGHVHDEHPFMVVGILSKTNSVLDNLILTNIESVWLVHQPEDESLATIDVAHATELHFDHDHDHDHGHEEENSKEKVNADSREITAILINCKTRMALLNMPRIINEQSNMQAVLPALEINRLFYMLGIGTTTIKLIAGGIMAMAGFSVFFVLYNRMRERKYELALMRTVGYRPRNLFALLLLEGFILATLGYILGWLLSRMALYIVNRQAESDFHFEFAVGYTGTEAWLLLQTILVGIVAAIIPAWQAMRMDVSATLSEN